MTAVYQGVDGAYSQLVLGHFLREHGIEMPTVGLPSFREMATAVAGARAAIGVIPIENAIVGTVREGYDLLAEFDLVPVSEIQWRTDHRLLGVRGAELRDVREVLAHPLVLASAARFLPDLIMRARFHAKTPASLRARSRGAAIRRSPRSLHPPPPRSTT